MATVSWLSSSTDSRTIRMSWWTFTLALILTQTFLSSCGGTVLAATGVGQGNVPTIDACSLLSSSEIETAVGSPIELPERNDAGYVADGAYSSACVWKIVASASAPQASGESDADNFDAPLGGRQFVILNAIRWPEGKGMARKFLDAFYLAAEKGDIPHAPVPRKLGDDALWWGDGLAVRKGDVSFGVSAFVPGTNPQSAEQIEEVLARRILSRIDADVLQRR